MVNKWKKALFSAALGMLCSAIIAIFLNWLTGHNRYLAIIGLGVTWVLPLASGRAVKDCLIHPVVEVDQALRK